MAVANRIAYNQFLDYRIFVVTAYHKDEFNTDVLKAASSQKLISISRTPSGNYIFLKYAIDEFVQSVYITRDIDGNPASMSINVFPIREDQTSEDFNFYYKRLLQYIPIFRRMDYIEVQVAELTLADDEMNSKRQQLEDFQSLILNDKRNYDYKDQNIAKQYRVRFRGFIDKVSDQDSAEDGRSIRLDAKSMMYFLANTPFITNLAIFNSQFFETQRIHILAGQYIVLYGDLLHDLRDTTTRTNILLEESFGIKSTISEIDKFRKRRNGTEREFREYYYRGNVSTNGDSEFNAVLSQLDTDDVKKTKGTQALLIPLAEIYFAYKFNVAENPTLYQIFKSELFDIEIQFEGTNTDFISKYTYLLQTLQQFKDSLKYFLFEETSGKIRFERPQFDADISKIVDPNKYISYDLTENATGFYTEVFATPGTAMQIFDDSIRETLFQSSGLSLEQLRRFGYRRPETETNPNISVPQAMQMYAKTLKAVNNATLRVLNLTIPYDKSIELGMIIWFQEKQVAGYVTSIVEQFGYAQKASMQVTLMYLRNIKKLNKSMEKITIDTLAKDVELEDFPEYTFISDFHSGNIQSVDQTALDDRTERALV